MPSILLRRDGASVVDGGAHDALQYDRRAGSRVGLIAPDDTTFAYIEGRPSTPHGAAWERPSTTGARCQPM